MDPATGNRTGTTSTTSTAATTASYSYPTASSLHPHAVSSVTTTVGAGSPTTKSYGYNAEGDTTTRPGETLTYDSEGHLATVTDGANTQSNTYDADGTLLLQKDGSNYTLYLGATELHKDGTGSVYAVRTYSLGGTAVAERTTGPTGGNVLRWLGGDNHNTATLEVVASTGATTARYQDPYGNPRGTNPSWSSGHTFLNDDQATTSSTVTVGARTYDPVIGKFLTVDAVLAPLNPLQNNGYSYAANSPVTLADPTGLDPAYHQCDNADTAACRNYFYGGSWTDHAPVAPGKTKASQLTAYLNSTTGVPKNLNVKAANACGWSSVCISQQPDRYLAGRNYHPSPGLANGCHGWKGCGKALLTVVMGVCLLVCGGAGEVADVIGGDVVESGADAAATAGEAAAPSEGGGESLYRGLNIDHPGYQDGLKGNTYPGAPDSSVTPMEHNLYDMPSPYTSWTTDSSMALGKAGADGLVLRIPTDWPGIELVESPDYYDEFEVLVRGDVTGAEIWWRAP